MTKFTEDPFLVETVDDELHEGSISESSVGSGSTVPGAEYGDVPEYLYIGDDKCRAIFSLKKGGDKMIRVCNQAGVERCNRPGHSQCNKASPGYYKSIKARKHVDGLLSTRLTKEEFEKREEVRRQGVKAELDAAAMRLACDTPLPLTTEQGGGEMLKAKEAKTSPRVTLKGEGNVASISLFPPKVEKQGDSALKPNEGKQGKLKDDRLYDNPPTQRRHTNKENKKDEIKHTNPVPEKGEYAHYTREDLAKLVHQISERLDSMSQHLLEEKGGTTSPSVAKVTGFEPDQPISNLRSKVWYYAVGRGKDNRQLITTSHEEARGLVEGIPHAMWKHFRTYEEAEDYLKFCKTLKVPRTYYLVMNFRSGRGKIYKHWSEASVHVLHKNFVTCKKVKGLEEAQERLDEFEQSFRESESLNHYSDGETVEEDDDEEDESFQDILSRLRGGGEPMSYEEYKREERRRGLQQSRTPNQETHHSLRTNPSMSYPPPTLMGGDISIKKEDKLFGIDTNIGESELRKRLTPPFLQEAEQKSLVHNTVDVTALPGTFQNVHELEDNTNEWTSIGHAMEELVNQGRGSGDNFGRADLQWRSIKRVSLVDVNSAADLSKRVQVLLKLQPKVHKRMSTSTAIICRKRGVRDESLIQAWSNQGWLPILVMRTYNYYLSLHQYLLHGAETNGWSYVRPEKDHYVDELRLIRQTSDCRLQCLCQTYILLRDGNDKNWFNISVQQERNQDWFKSTSLGNVLVCRKCGTSIIHGSDETTCPWKQLTDKKAKKEASSFLRKWKPGKKKEGGEEGKEEEET